MNDKHNCSLHCYHQVNVEILIKARLSTSVTCLSQEHDVHSKPVHIEATTHCGSSSYQYNKMREPDKASTLHMRLHLIYSREESAENTRVYHERPKVRMRWFTQ